MSSSEWIAHPALGALHDACDERRCPEQRTGTGRMRYDALTARWLVELRCPVHGNVLSWKPEYEATIAAALEGASS
jgi:hypothetical protein